MVVVPIVVLVIASNVGNALAPTLLPDPNDPNHDGNPLLLLALSPLIRNQVAVVNYVDPSVFLFIAGLRIVASGPLLFLIGRWYGESAIRWAERRSPTGGDLLRQFEGLFAKARIPIVVVFRHNLVAVLAGASGMNMALYIGLSIVGAAGRLVLIIIFGEAFSAPIDAVLGWIGDNRPWVLAVTVGLVVIGGLVQLRRGGGEIGQLRRLEHDLHAGGDEHGQSDDDAAPASSERADGPTLGDPAGRPTSEEDST